MCSKSIINRAKTPKLTGFHGDGLEKMNHALIYGGNGALGQAIVKHMTEAKKWIVTSVDLKPNPAAKNNIVLSLSDSWAEQERKVIASLPSILGNNGKLSAVICVAGGWAGGNAASDDLVAVCELMWKQSVQSSVLSSKVACKFLKESGLVVLTGAKAALGGTAGMIGYGMAKAAVHQLCASLASPTGSGLPAKSKVCAILPVTLDTPANRAAMPKADFSSWTPCSTVAEEIGKWCQDTELIKQNGSLFEIITDKGQTRFNARTM